MPDGNNAAKRIGFLTRLRKDERGNTLALFAAAIFPMAGLVGGAVDMGRVYSVKTRLQAACDAGSLAGRKVMANGKWDVDNNPSTQDAPLTSAFQMFDLNYADSYLGTTGKTRGFTESNGTVTGTASADVPMTLLRLLGQGTRNVAVTCNSMMKIPNTDVMFVLDVTGSMDQKINSTDSATKIQNLKIATRCFYEALARRNISDVTPAQCNKTSDPVGDLSPLTQLRFGFVPFSAQVNIGGILPNDYYLDNQQFQSRQANTRDVWTWVLNSYSLANPSGAWSPATLPTTYYARSTYTSGGASMGSGSDVTTTTPSQTLQRRPSTSTYNTSAKCDALNKLMSNGSTTTTGSSSYIAGIAVSEDAAVTTDSQNPAAPEYGVNNSVTITRKTTANVNVTGYYYLWSSSRCQLFVDYESYEKARATTSANVPLTWSLEKEFVNWTYKPVTYDVSALKNPSAVAPAIPYNNTIALPLATASKTVNRSKASSSSSLTYVTDRDVTWNGCIEEQQTFKNTDNTPGDDFTPIPASAYDMNLNLVPSTSDDATRWGFQLVGAVYNRGTTNEVTTTGNYSNPAAYCPSPSRKLTAYSDDAGAAAFSAYIGSLTAVGSTYHDIGLLWGGRLISPEGIFGSENAKTSNNADIARHLIFMTDGETQNTSTNYTPYGIESIDRRRTSYTGSDLDTRLAAITDTKTAAICSQIKNLGNDGVTVWVVYYGNLPDTDPTYLRMKACATSANHFFLASQNSQLLDAFNNIADAISELKLTS